MRANLPLLLIVLLAASVPWLSYLPPGVDLPQHAAQLRLLSDLLLGRASLSSDLYVNWSTPYWAAYGVGTLFAVVTDSVTAIKLLLSLVVVSTAAVWYSWSRKTHTPKWLNIFVLIGLFGPAWQWGFLTFLVAVPLSLYLILRCIHLDNSRNHILPLTLLFCLLFVSHVLVYVFTLLACAGSIVVNARFDRQTKLRTIVGIGLSVPLCAAWLVVGMQTEMQMTALPTRWDIGLQRLPRLAYGMFEFFPSVTATVLGLVTLLIPFALGGRFANDPARIVPLAVLTLFLLFLPSTLLGNYFTFERFSVFLPMLLAVAMRFETSTRNEFVAIAGACAIATCSIAIAAMDARRYAPEASAFVEVSKKLQDGKVLSMMMERDIPDRQRPPSQLHWGVWIQAMRGNWTDFNFAWFVPMVIRFHAKDRPTVDGNFVWAPERLDWEHHKASKYKYIVMNSSVDLTEQLVKTCPCSVALLARDGRVAVYETANWRI
jgi:hypothetical protein